MSQSEALEKYLQMLKKEEMRCKQVLEKANRALNRVQTKLIDPERSFKFEQKRGNKVVSGLLGGVSSSPMPKPQKKAITAVSKVEEEVVAAAPIDANLNEKEKKSSWFNPFND